MDERRTTLDHIDGITIPGSPFREPANEFWMLLRLWEGLEFLHLQVRKSEAVAAREVRNFAFPSGVRLSDRNHARVFAMGNVPGLRDLPMAMLECFFDWYAISACNYVEIVGSIHAATNPSAESCEDYKRRVLPEVLPYRNKVAAHAVGMRTDPRDNRAQRLASLIPQLAWDRDRLRVSTLLVAIGSTSGDSDSRDLVPWSLTEVHERLQNATGRPPVRRLPPDHASSTRPRAPRPGDLPCVDQAVPPPSDAQQPGPCPCHRARQAIEAAPQLALPAIEPVSRAERVDFSARAAVLGSIEQHVGQRISHFPGRSQRSRMEAIGEDLSRPTPVPIQSLGDAHEQSLQSSREAAAVLGLDQQV